MPLLRVTTILLLLWLTEATVVSATEEVADTIIIGVLLGVIGVFFASGIVLGCIVWRQHCMLRRRQSAGEAFRPADDVAVDISVLSHERRAYNDAEGGREADTVNPSDQENEEDGAVTVTTLCGVPIENRVRPRRHLPRGTLLVHHEDTQIRINFRQLGEVPTAEPPPPTAEELQRMEEAKNRIASPEFYGRAEYAERRASAPNSPEVWYGSFNSIKEIAKRYAGNYSGSSASVLSQSFNFGEQSACPLGLRSPVCDDKWRLKSGVQCTTRPSAAHSAAQQDIFDSTSDEFSDVEDGGVLSGRDLSLSGVHDRYSSGSLPLKPQQRSPPEQRRRRREMPRHSAVDGKGSRCATHSLDGKSPPLGLMSQGSFGNSRSDLPSYLEACQAGALPPAGSSSRYAERQRARTNGSLDSAINSHSSAASSARLTPNVGPTPGALHAGHLLEDLTASRQLQSAVHHAPMLRAEPSPSMYSTTSVGSLQVSSPANYSTPELRREANS